MANISLDAFYSDYLYIDFDCPKCRNRVHSDKILIPTPDLAAEKSSDSVVADSEWITCDNCDTSYDVDIASSFYGIEIEIDGVDDEEDNLDYRSYYSDEIVPHKDTTPDDDDIDDIIYNGFRLNSVEIPHWHILNDFKVDFVDNINVIIGENGAGKSTLIEAISLIFSDLHDYVNQSRSKAAFNHNYIISFSTQDLFTGEWINSIVKRVVNNNGIGEYSLNINEEDMPHHRIKGCLFQLLPTKIGLYYAGITDRLKKLSEKYEIEFQKIALDQANMISLYPLQMPSDRPFLYIKDGHLPILMLSLLISDSDKIGSLISDDLDVDMESLTIVFEFKKPYWAKGGVEKLWGASEFFTQFMSTFGAHPISRQTTDDKIIIEQNISYIKDEARRLFGKNSVKHTFSILDFLIFCDLLKSIQMKWENSDKQTIDFSHLSEGEKQLVSMSGLAELWKDEKGLLIFDEPDTFLHPKWQQNFISHINLVAQGTQVIITTHSPNIVSAIKKEQLFIMKNGKLRKCSINPYGKTVDGILIDHFETSTSRNIEVQDLINKLEKELTVNNVRENRDDIEKNIAVIESLIDPTDIDFLAIKFEYQHILKLLDNEENR